MSDHRTEFLTQLQLFDRQLDAGRFKKAKATLRALDELLGQLGGSDGPRSPESDPTHRARAERSPARAA